MPPDSLLYQRVVSYIKQGGKISEATQIFQVSRATIHRWLKRARMYAGSNSSIDEVIRNYCAE